MRTRLVVAGFAGVVLAATPLKASDAKPEAPDTSMTLPGGSAGRTLDSITVEGEDRVRVQFERPPLDLSLDPASAPGLDWNSMWAVLAPDAFDFTWPLLARSAFDRAWYAPRPWLSEFRSGPVARFRPQVEGVERWSLEVADSRGNRVAHFDGSGRPPKEIAWDGVTADGRSARADLTYSYVLSAMDKAGNKRSFVGDGFEIPPHLDESGRAIRMTFAVSTVTASVPDATIQEAASRINEAGRSDVPVRVEVTGPTFALAQSIADDIAASLRPLLRGSASRVATTAQVDAGGGERASVVIHAGSAPGTSAERKKN